MEEHTFQFFVDIKTRASGFNNAYEAYLVCTRFNDGGKVECACLHVDLGYYATQTAGMAPDRLRLSTAIAPFDQPEARLRDIIRVQAETYATRDEYLTGLLSEEATRAATFKLLKQGTVPERAEDVEQAIWRVADELGLREQWQAGQDLIKETKTRETEEVSTALQRYRKTDIDAT